MQVQTANGTPAVNLETIPVLKQEGCRNRGAAVSDDFTEMTSYESESSSQTSNTSLEQSALSPKKAVDDVETSVSLVELEKDQLEDCNRKTDMKIPPILKRFVSEPLHVKESRRSWKSLPKPDMEMIRRHSESLRKDHVNESTREKRRNRAVSFGEIEMRCYSQTLGDNPSVSYGPPISLDWDYEEIEPIALDSFEDSRPPRRKLRQMILSYYNRKNVLIWQYGVSEDELKEVKKAIKKERFNRSVTRSLVPIMPIEAFFESAGRKAKRAFGKKSA